MTRSALHENTTKLQTHHREGRRPALRAPLVEQRLEANLCLGIKTVISEHTYEKRKNINKNQYADMRTKECVDAVTNVSDLPIKTTQIIKKKACQTKLAVHEKPRVINDNIGFGSETYTTVVRVGLLHKNTAQCLLKTYHGSETTATPPPSSPIAQSTDFRRSS